LCFNISGGVAVVAWHVSKKPEGAVTSFVVFGSRKTNEDIPVNSLNFYVAEEFLVIKATAAHRHNDHDTGSVRYTANKRGAMVWVGIGRNESFHPHRSGFMNKLSTTRTASLFS
jgi:hypothetical protein